MISRQCPECEQVWFSANTGLWQCPGCGTKLYTQHALPLRGASKDTPSVVVLPDKQGKPGGTV